MAFTTSNTVIMHTLAGDQRALPASHNSREAGLLGTTAADSHAFETLNGHVHGAQYGRSAMPAVGEEDNFLVFTVPTDPDHHARRRSCGTGTGQR